MPYALKDIFDVAGMATTCHSKLHMNHRAAADATVVARLREAGAVLLGKLALHEFATGGPTRELPWPAALNPWDLDLHPGGSSSGSGVAVAAGLAPGTLGTDTGGSVRNPATCCGVIGMKPTYGLVSRTGVFPLSFSLDHVGPLTRTVEDNAILLGAIAGHDPADRSSTTRPLADCLENLHAGVKGLRIGVISHFYTEDLIGSPNRSPPSPRQRTCCAGSVQTCNRSACHRSRAGPTAGAPSSSPRPTPCMSATSGSGRRITPR